MGPFRYQASAGDCFPTSMVNALNALYPFPKIPAAAIQRIYQYSLDDARGEGTSDEAGRFLAAWLDDYKHGGFDLTTEFLSGPSVRLEPRGKILRHLRGGGVAVFDTYNSSGARHSILALRADKDAIDFWDPRYQPLPRRSPGPRGAAATPDETVAPKENGARRLLSPSPEEPNLRVTLAWLEKRTRKAYALGPPTDRCAILIRRT